MDPVRWATPAASVQTGTLSQNCSDITGTWTDGNYTYSISESSGIGLVTGTDTLILPYGSVQWNLSGQTSDGVNYQMKGTNPNPTDTDFGTPDEEDDFTLSEDCGYTPNGGFGYNLDLKLFWGAGQTQTASNNGSLRGATMQSCAAPLQASSFTQQYKYDSVNRLTSMTDSGGAGSAQAFSYDAYGNMWSNTTGTLPSNNGTPTTNVYNSANQLTTATYDAAGNQTSLPAYCSNCLSFDGGNRLVSYGGPTPAAYTYDAAGNRVTKKVGSTTTVYVYDAFNSLIAEYSSNPTTAVTACDRCYVSWDHLGSTRMVTDVNGNTVSLHDFEPFGGEINSGYAGRAGAWGGTADNAIEKFTGQVRDSESGLDYFNARYFSSAIGRFTSPDPGNAGANLYDPQSWNGYAHVRNNPLGLTDPSGRCFWCWFAPVLDVVAVLTAQPEIFGITSAVTGIGTASSIASAAAGIANSAALASSLVGTSSGNAGINSQPSSPPVSSIADEESLGAPMGIGVSSVGMPSLAASNGFLEPATVGAGVSGGTVLIDIGLGTLCVGTGVCEVVAIGAPAAVAVGAGAYIIYKTVIGRKLGPSGEPMIHNVDYPSKKAAYEGAKQAGKGEPEQHAHPKKGQPHFHSTGENGEIIKNGVHHNYPR